MDLSTTYRDRKLNIYTQDRKAAVDSFKCYWQINNMVCSRKFENFPLADGPNVTIFIDAADEQKECDEMLGAQNLKK